jgi:5-methyltetrahydrofolate corrinoid/iron sulfur protein methyltransferase
VTSELKSFLEIYMQVPEMTESFSGSVNRITLGATKDIGGTRTSTVTVGGSLNVVYGAGPDQAGAMQWLVETIQETCSTSLSLDSQKPDVIAAGLKAVNAENGVILNSTPLNKKNDDEIMDKYIEMATQKGPKASVIVLTVNKNDVPQDIDTRVAIAAEIISKAVEIGFDTQRLFIDPIMLPVKVPNAQIQPGKILAAMEQIRLLAEPAPHMMIGLFNLSQGATERSMINCVFLAIAISRGLDSAIVDVLDKNLMNIVATAEMLMNKQIYSDSFLKVYLGAN